MMISRLALLVSIGIKAGIGSPRPLGTSFIFSAVRFLGTSY